MEDQIKALWNLLNENQKRIIREGYVNAQNSKGESTWQYATIDDILKYSSKYKVMVSLHKKIKELSFELENVRKWFLLGLNIGQRISDLLKLKPNNFRKAPNGGKYVNLIQQKKILLIYYLNIILAESYMTNKKTLLKDIIKLLKTQRIKIIYINYYQVGVKL